MNTTIKTMEHKIDAKGKKLGRLASEIAVLLMGKNLPDFEMNKVSDVKVIVSNVDDMDISLKKMKEKKYIRYSGYPGGQKEEAMEKVIEKKGSAEILSRAVYGMLPGNKLRKKRMKRLIISARKS